MTRHDPTLCIYCSHLQVGNVRDNDSIFVVAVGRAREGEIECALHILGVLLNHILGLPGDLKSQFHILPKVTKLLGTLQSEDLFCQMTVPKINEQPNERSAYYGEHQQFFHLDRKI